ncbi:hypothetical protein Cyrtocomes_00646 [Candidatus Cyrtobacter comes]|uniref:Uncharacterized protein n=2 Tax=Candidatus Cyrtobacter comes TaxID=675776 RepID=A0ABU5L828_9RICK|nr:hypothetical protein [Candidatus Cyrtobacter comes]
MLQSFKIRPIECGAIIMRIGKEAGKFLFRTQAAFLRRSATKPVIELGQPNKRMNQRRFVTFYTLISQ